MPRYSCSHFNLIVEPGMLTTLNCLTVHGTERTQQGAGSAMKAVGDTGPDFMPRLFDIGDQSPHPTASST
jgi:hypothetical protein